MENTFFTTLAVDFYRPVFATFPETNFLIMNSLNYYSCEQNVVIYGFVIMPDHLHILWKGGDLVKSFKSFTAQKMINYLKELDPEYLSTLECRRADRKYKFWKSTSGNLEIKSKGIFLQKLGYIHQNPTKPPYALVNHPIDYIFSSALSYWSGKRNFPFLTVVKCNTREAGCVSV